MKSKYWHSGQGYGADFAASARNADYNNSDC